MLDQPRSTAAADGPAAYHHAERMPGQPSPVATEDHSKPAAGAPASQKLSTNLVSEPLRCDPAREGTGARAHALDCASRTGGQCGGPSVQGRSDAQPQSVLDSDTAGAEERSLAAIAAAASVDETRCPAHTEAAEQQESPSSRRGNDRGDEGAAQSGQLSAFEAAIFAFKQEKRQVRAMGVATRPDTQRASELTNPLRRRCAPSVRSTSSRTRPGSGQSGRYGSRACPSPRSPWLPPTARMRQLCCPSALLRASPPTAASPLAAPRRSPPRPSPPLVRLASASRSLCRRANTTPGGQCFQKPRNARRRAPSTSAPLPPRACGTQPLLASHPRSRPPRRASQRSAPTVLPRAVLGPALQSLPAPHPASQHTHQVC